MILSIKIIKNNLEDVQLVNMGGKGGVKERRGRSKRVTPGL
jgi:hypothetical protein